MLLRAYLRTHSISSPLFVGCLLPRPLAAPNLCVWVCGVCVYVYVRARVKACVYVRLGVEFAKPRHKMFAWVRSLIRVVSLFGSFSGQVLFGCVFARARVRVQRVHMRGRVCARVNDPWRLLRRSRSLARRAFYPIVASSSLRVGM